MVNPRTEKEGQLGFPPPLKIILLRNVRVMVWLRYDQAKESYSPGAQSVETERDLLEDELRITSFWQLTTKNV